MSSTQPSLGFVNEDGFLVFSSIVGGIFNSSFATLIPITPAFPGFLIGITIGVLGKSLVGLSNLELKRSFFTNEDFLLFIFTLAGLIFAAMFSNPLLLASGLVIAFIFKAVGTMYPDMRGSAMINRGRDSVEDGILLGLSIFVAVLIIGILFQNGLVNFFDEYSAIAKQDAVLTTIINLLLFVAVLAKSFPSIAKSGNP